MESNQISPADFENVKGNTIYKNSELTGSYKRTLNFEIEGSIIGRIIGKGGANIKKTREESNCYINFIQNNPLRLVTITPGDYQVLQVSGKVSELTLAVESLANCLVDADDVGDGKTSMFLILQTSQAMTLIGEKGINSKNISTSTNIRLRVFTRKGDRAKEVLVRLSGSPKELAEAIKLIIVDYIKDTRRYLYQAERPALFRTGSNIGKDKEKRRFLINTVQTIKISKEYAGWIIGKNGRIIKKIIRESGAKIVITTPDDGEETEIKVSGRPSETSIAFQMIEDIIENYLSRESSGNRSHNSKEITKEEVVNDKTENPVVNETTVLSTV